MHFLIFPAYSWCQTYGEQIYPPSDRYNITSIAGQKEVYSYNNGLGSNATFNYPIIGTAIDNDGNIFVCDFTNNAIRKIDKFGNVIITYNIKVTTFIGDGPNMKGDLDGPINAARINGPTDVIIVKDMCIYISN
jgi:hypothetical protein